MKSSVLFVFFLVIYLLRDGNMICARKELLGEYWKNMMMEQPMPDSIKELIEDDKESESEDGGKDHRFTRNFDIKPNVILYHTTHHHKHQPEPHFMIRKSTNHEKGWLN
ncbi:hypothetical protein PIB30_008164 [Stylosanthes scabra]|uniref:Uncharacterized protein n=1 Tax=Stylosanthes scabra TaxID=79078 RepID=A0ABU6Y2W9_9FABA|nr:hypothetical protein [Stylosanthes scabra]